MYPIRVLVFRIDVPDPVRPSHPAHAFLNLLLEKKHVERGLDGLGVSLRAEHPPGTLELLL
jgi:hypothetical protein